MNKSHVIDEDAISQRLIRVCYHALESLSEAEDALGLIASTDENLYLPLREFRETVDAETEKITALLAERVKHLKKSRCEKLKLRTTRRWFEKDCSRKSRGGRNHD